jgi:hypothetical protein
MAHTSSVSEEEAFDLGVAGVPTAGVSCVCACRCFVVRVCVCDERVWKDGWVYTCMMYDHLRWFDRKGSVIKPDFRDTHTSTHAPTCVHPNMCMYACIHAMPVCMHVCII